MKKVILSMIVVALACASCSVPQTAVMDKIRQIDNIEATRTPVSALSSIPFVNVITKQIPILNDLKTLDIMKISDPSAKNKARKLLDQFYKGDTYELLLMSKQNARQGFSVYALPMGDGQYSDVVIINDNNATINIMELKGTLSKKDLNLADFSNIITEIIKKL